MPLLEGVLCAHKESGEQGMLDCSQIECPRYSMGCDADDTDEATSIAVLCATWEVETTPWPILDF